MRNLKRLFPFFLITILLAGTILARPAGAVGSSSGQLVAVAKSQSRPAYDNPRFYFGTVVRDTADDQGYHPGYRQVEPQAPLWFSLFNWNWACFMVQQ